jgi:hypothetical protein
MAEREKLKVEISKMSTPEAIGVLAEIMLGLDGALKRLRHRNWFVIALISLLLLALVGVGWSVYGVIHERNQRTVAACLNANEQIQRTRDALDHHDKKWGELLVPEPRSADDRQEVRDALKALHGDTVKNNPLRDCTQAGIRAFYARQGKHTRPTATTTTRPKVTTTTKGH